jgi:phosphoglycolate phosphatase
VQTLCKKYFGDRVSTAVGEREGIRRKPYPDSVLEVLGKANIDPADAVYIGDSEVDVETAENAGTDVVCVTWGFRDKDFLVASGAKKFVDSASELLSLLIRE